MSVETVNSRGAAGTRVESAATRFLFRAGESAGPSSWLLYLAVGVVFVLLFAQRFFELYLTWLDDPNYSHGFLVPLVSAFLVWQLLQAAGLPQETNRSLGAVWLGWGCFLHLVAVVVWLPPVDFLALVAICYGFALVVGGRDFARSTLFPILFLFFMFPLPVVVTERIGVWLQQFVATVATLLLQLFLPVTQEGNFIYLPGQQLEVGEACSGLRQVVAFAALTMLVAYMSQRSVIAKVALVISGIPVAIAANLLRVLLMAFIMRQFGPKYVEGAYHSFWGLVTMAAGLGLLCAVNWWLGRVVGNDSPTNQEASTEVVKGTLGEATTDVGLSHPRGTGCRPSLQVVFACLAMTLVGQWLLQVHLQAGELGESAGLQRPLTGFPVSLGAWLGQDIPPTTLPYFALADDKLFRDYRLQKGDHEGLQAQLWMVHFFDGRDRQHHPIICFKVAGYSEELSGRDSLRLPGRTSPIEQFAFTKKGSTSYVYYWHYTFEPPPRKDLSLLQIIHQRRGRLLPSLTIQLFATPQKPDSLEELAKLVEVVDDHVQAHLPPGARMGSDILPVRYTGDPRNGPIR